MLVIDGGQPQVEAAARALRDRDVHDVVVMGLAKRLEEVWLPSASEPIILPRGSEGLYLLQRMRDEAHRFAIGSHRARRKKEMVKNPLDEIAGIGPTRKRALLQHFGTAKAVSRAATSDLMAVEGISQGLAEAIHGFFNPG